jgi:hypothetical protein
MAASRRSTVYLDAELHRALRLKSADTDSSLSELVNNAVRQSLLEDAEDLAAIDERAPEPHLDFGQLVKDLKRRGKL